MRTPKDLQEAAIDLALDKSMEDVQTLLRWVVEAEDPGQAVGHIRRAQELLEEIEENLVRLDQS